MDDATIRTSLESYIAAWNETDEARRATLLARACADGFRFVTPGRVVHGRAGLEALIADFRRRRPTDRAVLTSAIDVQGTIFRFAGMIDGPDVTTPAHAFDAGECDAEGRIALLMTFVGAALPPRAG